MELIRQKDMMTLFDVRIVIVTVEAATYCIATTCSSGPALHHSTNLIILAQKKNYFKYKVENMVSAICALHNCLNPIFSNGVFPELLFGQFI